MTGALLQPFPVIESSGVRLDILDLIWNPYAPGIGQTGMLQTAVLPDGVHEILLADFTFRWRGVLYTVPRGFVSDFASVPRFFQRILPQRGKYSPAAVVHDWLYWSGVLPKADADLVLYELSERLGVPWHDRALLYRGVWLPVVGGIGAWNEYRSGKGAEFQTA